MNTSIRVGVVIPAAGKGIRFGSKIPKQFLLLHNEPVLIHTLRHFENHQLVSDIVVVTSEDSLNDTEKLLHQFNIAKVRDVVIGGKERQVSVYNGCLAILKYSPDTIMVHDAVRPCINADLIGRLILEAKNNLAVVPVLSVKDTIGEIDENGKLMKYYSREHTRIIQTPQVFNANILLHAFALAFEQNYYNTDESSLVQRSGVSISTIDGVAENIKITTEEDLEIASNYLRKIL
ncbi:MAG: 2-C-methyl-D-erythritol 4-phosphate cytidylyltransferase [Bacteroidota bacterium]